MALLEEQKAKARAEPLEEALGGGEEIRELLEESVKVG